MKKKPRKPSRKRLGVSVRAETFAKLQALAKQRGVPVSELLDTILSVAAWSVSEVQP